MSYYETHLDLSDAENWEFLQQLPEEWWWLREDGTAGLTWEGVNVVRCMLYGGTVEEGVRAVSLLKEVNG